MTTLAGDATGAGLGRSFAPYLPPVLASWTAEESRSRLRTVSGSLVFMDVSGFTALSEKLAVRGREGAEELTGILDARFTELLSLAAAEGGSLLKFGGDALLLLFDGDEHALRACRAALRMRRALRDAGAIPTSAGTVRLRMSVGVHSDELHLFRVGRSHEELVVTGPAATRVVEAEAAAGSGTILISASTARLLPRAFCGEPDGDLFRLTNRRIGPSPEAEPTPAPADSDLSRAVPAALREPLSEGELEPAHRTVSIGFVRFSNIDSQFADAGAETVAGMLDDLVSDVQEAADANGVTFLGTDVDRDGGKIILVAGAPRLLGEDEERMLRAVSAIASKRRALPVAIGVHRGHVFAGEVGPSYRRTYTVIGDAVNLAARLMAAAGPGRVLVTDEVLDRSRTRFETVAVPAFRVKGREEPVAPRLLGEPTGVRSSETDALPLFGRDSEAAALQERLDALRGGRGGRLEIAGAVGLGKSRLLRELKSRAAGLTVRLVTCEPYEAATPFFAFRVLMRSALEPVPGHDDLSRRLHAAVDERAPELAPWVALLADVLGLDAGPLETPQTSALEPRFRREKTALVARDFLLAMHPDPVVFAFDDVHHMDDVSKDLLAALSAVSEDHPVMVVTTTTETSGEGIPDRMLLEPLGHQAASALAEAAAGAPLAPHEQAAVLERADGNPLFLESLARAARREGAELPGSLEAVIGSEIDALGATDRTLLRQASVLGATFELPLLEEILSLPPGGAEGALARLDRFLDMDARHVVRFRHRLQRDTAYAALPFAKRRELHARAGFALERMATLRPDPPFEMLSLHFFEARDHDRAWRYGYEAAERARLRFANVEAVELYDRAIRAARKGGCTDQAALGMSLIMLGDVANLAGFYDRSDDAYRSSLDYLTGDHVQTAIVWLRRARLASRKGRTALALSRITRGLRAVGTSPEVAAARARADLNVLYAWMRQQQGRPLDAAARCRMVLEEAEPSQAVADALLLLDWISLELGRPDEAVNADRALAILEEVGAFEELAVALNNLGGYAYFQGKWNEAIDRYVAAGAAFARIGDTLHAALAESNLAEIRIDQGRLDEAETSLRRIADLWRSLDFDMGAAIVRNLLARVALRRGDIAAARIEFSELREAFTRLERPMKVLEVEAWLAEAELQDGRAAEALRNADGALRRQRSNGGSEMASKLLRIKAQALVELGRLDEAQREALRAIEAARTRGSRFDAALSLRLADRIAAARGDDPVDRDGEAEAWFVELGVISPAG